MISKPIDDPVRWIAHLETGLREDQALWDHSAGLLPNKSIQAKIVAKEPGTWAATGLFEALSESAWTRNIKVTSIAKPGSRLKANQVVAQLRGPARDLLRTERTLLNLAQYACGIATQTRTLCDLADSQAKKLRLVRPPRVTPTRKTLPGYRDIALFAAQVGGASLHRMNLGGGVLLKENHLAQLGGATAAIDQARSQSPHPLRIEVEVRSPQEALEATSAGAEIVMLDNFSVDAIRETLQLLSHWVAARAGRARPWIEVSGGVNESNIVQFVLPGVDVISVGGLTHSVKALDLSFLVAGVR